MKSEFLKLFVVGAKILILTLIVLSTTAQNRIANINKDSIDNIKPTFKRYAIGFYATRLDYRAIGNDIAAVGVQFSYKLTQKNILSVGFQNENDFQFNPKLIKYTLTKRRFIGRDIYLEIERKVFSKKRHNILLGIGICSPNILNNFDNIKSYKIQPYSLFICPSINYSYRVFNNFYLSIQNNLGVYLVFKYMFYQNSATTNKVNFAAYKLPCFQLSYSF